MTAEALEHAGRIPIPPYLEREDELIDKSRYQTVYSAIHGSVAAPTAGLHFTRETMMRLEIKGVDFSEVTVFQGASYGRSVEVEDLTKHKMDSESMFVPEETSVRVNKALDEKKKICAVGSGAMRAIETSVSAYGRLNPSEQWTDKFIFPPYEFKICNALISNFHYPQSTLLMMNCAFGGYDLVMEAYELAIKEKYRFFSYGDAMLII